MSTGNHGLSRQRPVFRATGLVAAVPLLAGFVWAQPTPAQDGGGLALKTVRQIEALLAAKAQRPPAQRKVSSRLLDLAGESADARRQSKEASLADELVEVDIRAEVTAAVLERIRALGGTVINSVPKYRAVRARLPIAAVEKLAALDAVQSIRDADMAFMRDRPLRLATGNRLDTLADVGTRKDNTSEGDVAHRANTARSTHSVDGAGIGIGVLADGVLTLAARQASGDLPDRVTVLPGQAGTGYEGTAMLEIVHDLAPGADLYFATAFAGQAQFAANIEALCDAGADVIVDDVFYFREPAFQDGIIARGVNAAVADGCFYFSAGGNGGNQNDGTAGVWEGDYAAGSTVTRSRVTAGVAHDFGGGVELNRITADGEAFVLQWADPLGKSANDYDLFLIGANDNVLRKSTDVQDGTQDPIEYISSSGRNFTNARLLIVKTAGAAARYLRLDTIEGRLAITTAGNLSGHAAAENTVTVAAVDVRGAAGAGGVFKGTESVTKANSDGPRRIFFQPDGTPITAGNFSSTGGKLLQKPELAAAACVSVTVYSRFCGTSSAAPHAAAIAALLLEGAGGPGNVTQAALRTAMTGTALDIEATGTDRDSGAGIVMAPGAVDAVDVAVASRNKAPEVESPLQDRTLIRGGSSLTVNVASSFSEPDNQTLTYKALSSNPGQVAVARSGSRLTLTPGLPGRASVTVRATDPSGLSVAQSFSVTVALGTRDYDADDDNLIEVGNLAQLDAMRLDLNGNGLVDDLSNWRSYYGAFPQSSLTGCPDGCAGYELTASLDFDTNNSGDPDAGDDYWNGGKGWAPIGGAGTSASGTSLFLRNPFTATFEGNGHTVNNLFIDTDNLVLVGLFGYATSSIRNLGVSDADVTGDDLAGGLIGWSSGEIRGCYVTGSVTGTENVGGIAGINRSNGKILASYATSVVSGEDDVGGLVGDNRGEITAGYATGRVTGMDNVGGLVGLNRSRGTIRASYATGRVTGDSDAGGLVGSNEGVVTAGYWDSNTSGHATGSSGAGRTTTQLQAPTGYNGIYQSWNADIDGDNSNDNPWSFGANSQYPVLSVDTNGAGGATWQEFGHQLREGPTLTATAEPTQVELIWTAVGRNHWSPMPGVTYTLYRESGAASKTLGKNLNVLTFTDTGVTSGTAYTYQVAAVVTGGEAARSSRVSATPIPPPAPPMVTLTAQPSSIQRGQSAMLRWTSQNATAITLQPGIGAVAAQGSRSVSPSNSTTYTITAQGPGGSARATARVTVTDPPPPSQPPPSQPPPSQPPPSQPPPSGGFGGGFGGGGGGGAFAPSEPRNLTAAGGDGEVVLAWDAPEDDGGAAISDYEYRNVGRDPWTSTGSTDTTHTVSGLANGTAYVFEVRAVNRIGKSFASDRAEATPRAPEKITLGFPHFANGEGVTSEVVLLNVGTTEIRPALYFHGARGAPLAAASVVEVTDDLEVVDDGGLTVRTALAPLSELTVATHGRGEQVSGSVKVVSEGPIGGVLRYGVPGVGVTGVGAGRPVRDALFPARRKQGGIRTAAALHNVGEEALEVTCGLMSGGVVLEEAMIPLEANGQTSWFIEEAFPMTGATDFTGTVRCTAPQGGRFSGLAVEVDAGKRIFTTLPVVPVDRTGGEGGATVLDFAHFANGAGITSELVFVNVETRPSQPAPTPFHQDVPASRPVIHFYDQAGRMIDPASVVEVAGDLEVTEEGALTVRTAMAPLGELTVATHGRGEQVSGSVRVVSEGPIGGVLRYGVPGVGVTGVGAGQPVGDALFPARRKAGGIRTAAALRNLEEEAIEVQCRLMSGGAVLEEAEIPLAANGQVSWFIEEAFTATDTTDFVGTVRCTAPGEGSEEKRFTGLAVEVDAANRIFTTLPVVAVEERMPQE